MQGGKIAVVRFLEVKEGSLGSSKSHMIRVDGSRAWLDGDVAKFWWYTDTGWKYIYIYENFKNSSEKNTATKYTIWNLQQQQNKQQNLYIYDIYIYIHIHMSIWKVEVHSSPIFPLDFC